jgi:hypothetical protein
MGRAICTGGLAVPNVVLEIVSIVGEVWWTLFQCVYAAAIDGLMLISCDIPYDKCRSLWL